MKIINFEHALHPGLGLEINNSKFGVPKIVLLAMSCSINVSKRTLEREEREETNRVMKINANEPTPR
jgi:hypothetical protein